MTFFKEGDNPQPRTPNAKCYAFTFGVDLANGKTTPCTAQGQKAQYVYGDTVEAVENGFAVPVLSKDHSGGIGVPCLAGGAVSAGADVIVGMVNFVDNDGATVSLPVAIAAADGLDGDWIVARATMGSSASEADTDVNAPSLALFFYDNPMQVVGGEVAESVLTFPVDLATIATGNVIDGITPGFAGEILSHSFVVNVPASTAGGDVALNLEINATNVTGGVVTLTTATATPQGKVIAGTAITAANVFGADDTLSVEAVVTGAFTEGSGTITIVIRALGT